MPRHKISTEPIDRIVIKIPVSLAKYFRETFRHGQRSEFLANCIRRHKREQELKSMDDELSSVGHRS